MILYKINQNTLYFDGIMEVPDDPENIYGRPYGTTRIAIPDLPADKYARWNGSGWDIVDPLPVETAPSEEPPPPIE